MRSDPIDALIEAEQLPISYRAIVEQYWTPLATRIAREAGKHNPLIVGINGGQGTGKSTMCMFLEELLKRRGVRAITLGLDDLYLGRAARAEMAAQVHPLYITRGVPGTHTIREGLQIIEAVLAGRSFTMPRFSKADDDRLPEGDTITGPVDVVLFEGWCVGAVPQDTKALTEPVNTLEAQEDTEATWRIIANQFLAAEYADIFAQIDLLVMLKVKDFDAVLANRKHQENKLRARQPNAPVLMDDTAIERFCAHYERLTNHILAEMPARTDIVFEIGADQAPLALPDNLSL